MGDVAHQEQDIEQLLSIMERYDHLDDFLADMALEPPNAAVENRMAEADKDENRLTLSTVHSAKGLEWDTVFVIWALDGRFPSHHAIDRPEALEEERRLMYVAATRSEQNLFLTYPVQIYDRATQSVLSQPSRFLEDIPYDMVEQQFFSS